MSVFSALTTKHQIMSKNEIAQKFLFLKADQINEAIYDETCNIVDYNVCKLAIFELIKNNKNITIKFNEKALRFERELG